MSEKPTKPSQKQYLTFKLSEEMFALDVSQVREILDFTQITRVPLAPGFMRGVINVRGSVVPVVDLGVKFGLPESERTEDTRIVVMEINLAGEACVIGALADAVHNVMDIEADQIEATPKIGTKWDTDFIKGIGKHNAQFIILLDVDRVFTADDLVIVQQTEVNGAAA